MRQDDFIRQSIHENLSGLHVSRRRQQNMIDEITGGKIMKKKIAFSIVLAVALTIISISALAAGIVGVFGNANWSGDVIPEEEQERQSHVTSTPSSEAHPRELLELKQGILSNRGERELVVVSDRTNASTYAPRIQTLHNMAEFEAMMETALNLPVPTAIPDGYSLTSGHVIFDCLPEGKFSLISADTLPEGITVSRYKVDESMDFVSGYELQFNGAEKEDYISVFVRLSEHSDLSEHSFSINPNQQIQATEVQGMDNALLITSDDSNYLVMRRMLAEPVEYLAYDCSDPVTQSWTGIFEECQIRLYASRLSKDHLADIFAGN